MTWCAVRQLRDHCPATYMARRANSAPRLSLFRACCPHHVRLLSPECSCVSRGPRPGDVADMLWRGLNSYNFAPLLSKDVPRHSRCEQCVTCKQRFMLGVEGGSINDKGKVCLKCALAAVGASPEMLASGRLPLPTFQYDPPSSTDQPTPAGL